MTSFAAEAFDSGLFSLLTVVLNSEAPGFSDFKRRATNAWQALGLKPNAVEAVLFDKKRLTAEQYRSALREEMPILIEASYGSEGRAYYDLGFTHSTLLLSLMVRQEELVKETVRELKYKSAEAHDPENLHDRVRRYEQTLESGSSLDLIEVMKSTEELHLWIVANVSIHRRGSIADALLAAALGQLPYVGAPLRRFYEHVRAD